MKRLEVQTLRGAGIPVDEVARHAGVSPRSVRRVAKEDPITDPVAVDDAASKRVGRPSKVARHEQEIERWLSEDPKIPTNHVLERLRDLGYDGSKSAVYDVVRRLRAHTPQKGVSRFEGLPGEFSQHDFGEVWVHYRDGARERIKFFASVLKYSRLRRVMLVADETTETVCHALVDAMRYFEGMPLIAVFDNPKTIVSSRDGDRVEWNPTFGGFCAEAGIVPRATWPRRPQEKGAVENGVGHAKSSFFKAHVFEDREDLETRLEEWHRRVNDERPSRATGEIPRTRHLLEKPLLRMLGVEPNGFRLRYTRVVDGCEDPRDSGGLRSPGESHGSKDLRDAHRAVGASAVLPGGQRQQLPHAIQTARGPRPVGDQAGLDEARQRLVDLATVQAKDGRHAVAAVEGRAVLVGGER